MQFGIKAILRHYLIIAQLLLDTFTPFEEFPNFPKKGIDEIA